MIPSDPPEDEIQTPYVRLRIEGKIMYCTYADDLDVTLEVAKACVETRLQLSRGKSYPVIVDMRGIKSTSRDAREYLASVGSTLVTAGALVTGSKFNMALGNIFLTIDKPPIPTKLFTSEAKAKEWIEHYCNQRPIL